MNSIEKQQLLEKAMQAIAGAVEDTFNETVLNDAPLGACRRKAMAANARHVESESIDLGGLNKDHPNFTPSCGGMDLDHIFFQRVKLLAVMVKAVGEGHPMGAHRKTAMRDNIDIICETITLDSLQDISLLRVA
ncbi:MAG: hypothetical protein PVH87_24110 [Desulfobacteraceae bacterium]|jgi:hypothetical protein